MQRPAEETIHFTITAVLRQQYAINIVTIFCFEELTYDAKAFTVLCAALFHRPHFAAALVINNTSATNVLKNHTTCPDNPMIV